jgi:prophage regulatory protein
MAGTLTRPSWLSPVPAGQEATPSPAPAVLQIDRLLRLPEVVSATGRRRTALYQDIERGVFPHGIPIGRRAVAWPSSWVAAVIAARIAGEDDDALRRIVADLETSRTRRPAA